MSSTRKRKQSVDTDNQAQELPISTSSSTAAMLSTSPNSTSALPSALSSSARTESKEEKEANGREEKHNTSDDPCVNDEMLRPLHNIILGYSGYVELPNMTGGSSSLFQSIKTAKTIKLMKLFTAIVSGDPATVNSMIDQDPSFLLSRTNGNGYITSPSGQRSNNLTLYRTALAVEDTQMAAFIKNKMVEQKVGDLADQQYREQFPAGWEVEEEKRWAPVFTALETLTHAIKDAKAGDITSTGDPEYKLTLKEGSAIVIALAQFRLQLDTRLNETVTTGRHFNPNLLLRAFESYSQHYAHHFSDPRALLFWQQVIGTIQRALPVNYVQAFCDGLDRTVEKLRNNTPQGRSLRIMLPDTSRREWVPHGYYPLAGSRLGFEYAAGGRSRVGWVASRSGPFGHWGSVAFASLWLHFVAYVNQIQRACRDLCTSATLENLQRFAR